MSVLISKTEAFLKETFNRSIYLQEHPAERDYRLEHSYRVANIAKQIADKEGFNTELAVIAGLLHDIAYCKEMPTREEQIKHGRKSAEIARPFLESIGISENEINDICYSIAIHVDDKSDFEWKRTAFSETVGDADNIDRFDAYRIYETLQYQKFNEMVFAEKLEHVKSMIDKLCRFKELKFGTATAQELWRERLDYYSSFYNKLLNQLNNSNAIL